MYEIIITTKEFVDEFAQFEIEDWIEKDFTKIKNGIYLIKFQKEESKVMYDFIYNLFYFSRVIESIYLKIFEFNSLNNINEELMIDKIKNEFNYLNLNLSFEVDSKSKFDLSHNDAERKIGRILNESLDLLKVNLDNFDLSFKLISIENGINFLALDLIGFNLLKRNYKINSGSHSINSIIPNYVFYLLGIDEINENYSLIDPCSDLGDIVIEASSFNPRLPLNLNKKHRIPLKKIFNYPIPTPNIKNKISFEDENSREPNKFNNKLKRKNKIIKPKIYSVVQNNKSFKLQRENLNYSGFNIKISQYELNWLDVKFKEAEIDFIVTQIPEFQNGTERDEFLKELFYQIEFIFNKGIGIISKTEINEKYFRKNELEIQFKNKIFIAEQQYFIYILV